MKQPSISVVMPVYNCEQYLHTSIPSILNQSFGDFEFIIINDGSTDGSAAILEQYRLTDSRIRVITFQKNSRLVAALNAGLKVAQGKYIARMDADDISMPNRFKIQYEFLEKNESLFLVSGSYFSIDESGKTLTKVERSFKLNQLVHPQDAVDIIGYIAHSTVVFRNVPGLFYREKAQCSEDRDLWLRLINEGKELCMTTDIVLQYRIHKQSFSTVKYTYQSYLMHVINGWFFERMHHGKDSYDQFDLIEHETRTKSTLSLNQAFELRILSQFVAAHISKGKMMRRYIWFYWRTLGFFTEKKLILSYVATFFPHSVKMLVKSFLSFFSKVR